MGKNIGTGRIIGFLFFLYSLIISAPLFSQSRIPAEATNYIQTTANAANGDQDAYMVVFYEVPDTITSTLYFAINHPGCTD